MRTIGGVVLLGASSGLAALLWPLGCGGAAQSFDHDGGSADGSRGDDATLDLDGGTVPPLGDGSLPNDGSSSGCVNLQCQQHTCSGGGSTTISGTVYDPAGKNPLYNVVVYVPNAKLEALPSGASCDSCNALYTGSPIAVGLTDAAGKFTIPNAPDGADIPLVVQVGKWRKQMTLPSVTACQDNPQPDRSIVLPRNGSEGDIPNIAVSTGGADTLECLLRRVGVDASEYVAGAAAGGHIHIFQGSGGAPTIPGAPKSSASLWTSKGALMPYDILLLSCEGDETAAMNQQSLYDYANAGGRIFASHYHYSWFSTGPFGAENLATWTPGLNDITATAPLPYISATIETTLPSGQPFPKGVALKQWLGNVNALSNGELNIYQAKHNADVRAANTPSQAWITADQANSNPNATEYFSFNTPVQNYKVDDAGQPLYCGRVVYSDLHVAGNSADHPNKMVPSECMNADLSAQEKALEFMLFDLSSCVSPDDKPPPPPPPPPPR
jgi:hypothetical protein